MADDSTEVYFSFFDKLNADIAARKDQEEEVFEFGVDQHQVKRDKKYRDKWKQPRARPRSRGRPKHARIVQGSMEIPGADNPDK